MKTTRSAYPRTRCVLAAGLLLGLLWTCGALVPSAWAQTSNATLEVLTVDETGGALPGATVTVRSLDTGAERSAPVTSAGVARFAALAPGDYRVEVALDGFATAVEERASLRLGQTVQLKMELRPQTSESITVAAAVPLVDVYKTDSSTNILPEQIEYLPVADRDFQRLAFIAPGVQRERGSFRFINGGPVIGAGGNASQSTILVDGVDYTDPALGLARIRFSQDAIAEFRVVAGRFDSEVGGSAGGALSVIPRRGSNNLSGSLFAFYRDDSLRQPGALEQGNRPFERKQLGFTLGGPIQLDKTHFFLSYERIDEDNVTLFRPGGAFAGLAADVSHPFNQDLAYGGLDFQLGSGSTLEVRAVADRYREDNFRVGGVSDVSYGQELQRDNWNLSAGHVAVLAADRLNELRVQGGHRKYFEPTNSDAPAEWFSSGNTLQTGGNILGDLLGEGDFYELRETYHLSVDGARSSHDIKLGGALLYAQDRSIIDTFATGLFTYLGDTRAIPVAYLYGVGSSDVTVDSTRYSAFVQDDWRVSSRLTVSLGLRYDLDDGGNNPGFTHPLVPRARPRDTNDFQPRVSFTYDLAGDGNDVLRGGAGLFNGRYLLVPAFTEEQQNGVTGRTTFTRINGLLLGLAFPPFILDPAHPTTTGVALKPDISLLAPELDTPETIQVSLGWTHRFAGSDFFLDTEAVWADGDNEIVIRDVNWTGNATRLRPISAYNQVNMYTNDGRSTYKALITKLQGTFGDGHLLTVAMTLADKQNIADDFSPAFPIGYPNDPADIDAEYGRSQSDERFRLVASSIFRLPWDITVAPIYEYGSGQPWNHRLGYDFNGDGKNSDRPAGVDRNSENGPRFSSLSVRVTKAFHLGTAGRLEAIAEAFNLLDTRNDDPSSIDGAEFLSGPTAANPALPFVANPNFGKARATFPGREVQLGLRWSF